MEYKINKMDSEQNARLDVSSLASVIKYCKENNKIKTNMQINFQWISPHWGTQENLKTHTQTPNKYFVGIL